MKAMQLGKPQPVHFRPLKLCDLEAPRPSSDELLVRIRVCGVCHTDLHTVEGELGDLSLPVIPGHQAVGTVEAIGDRVRGFRCGERVGVAWLHRTCGHCPYCARGDENLCDAATFTGFHVPGGFAESLTVPSDFAYRLPKGISDEQAAPLLCAGIIGYRALRLSGIRPGGRLGLYGFGASAHIAIQVAIHWNCTVYAFSRSEAHRRLAVDLGAVWTGQSDEAPPQKLDAAVVFAPAGSVVPQALEHLDRGGTVALGGIYMSEIPPLDYARHLYYERALRSVTAATRKDGRELLQLAAKIPVRTTVRTYPLHDANLALLDLKKGRVNGAAVLTVP